MGISGESIKTELLLRTDQYGLTSSTTNALLDMYIDSVCTEIAAKHWYRDLLQTAYITSDDKGKFSMDMEIIPYLTFAYGREGVDHSWQRLTPVDYEYWESWRSRVFRGQYVSGGNGVGGGVRRRYCILPQGDPDTTSMQILENTTIVPIKLIYYPIRPSVSEFPTYFKHLIVNKVLEALALDKMQGSNDRFFKQLQEKTKQLEKLLTKQASRIEVNSYDATARNRKTQDWIDSESNDVSYWLR